MLSHWLRKGRKPDAEARISSVRDSFSQSSGRNGTQCGRDALAVQTECMGALPDLSDQIGDVAAADHLPKRPGVPGSAGQRRRLLQIDLEETFECRSPVRQRNRIVCGHIARTVDLRLDQQWRNSGMQTRTALQAADNSVGEPAVERISQSSRMSGENEPRGIKRSHFLPFGT
ncbi:hypothetical protein [Bradyrhizobium murdochi]|uniref:hypothetical protein n=1 Tax=Bradyrhizobium murdochi TaxID=1038859 RepID=UPI0012EB444E|nr:hypothetical protein [Bradyrhizobium murdochi]